MNSNTTAIVRKCSATYIDQVYKSILNIQLFTIVELAQTRKRDGTCGMRQHKRLSACGRWSGGTGSGLKGRHCCVSDRVPPSSANRDLMHQPRSPIICQNAVLTDSRLETWLRCRDGCNVRRRDQGSCQNNPTTNIGCRFDATDDYPLCWCFETRCSSWSSGNEPPVCNCTADNTEHQVDAQSLTGAQPRRNHELLNLPLDNASPTGDCDHCAAVGRT